MIVDNLQKTFTGSILLKSVFGVMLGIFTTINGLYPELIHLMLVIFLVDMLLGLIRSIKYKIFSSTHFFKGILKLGVYLVLILIAHRIDLSLGGNIFLGLFLGSIIFRDSSSIIENLEELGFQIPTNIKILFNVAKNRFINEKIEAITGKKTYNFGESFRNIRDNYLPAFKNKEYKMLFSRDIDGVEDIANKIASNTSGDVDNLKLQTIILLDNETEHLCDMINKSNIKKVFKDNFKEKHKNVVEFMKKEIRVDISNKNFEMEKTSLINILIRGIIKGIGIGLSSPRNTEYELYSKGCIGNCEKCTLETCVRTGKKRNIEYNK